MGKYFGGISGPEITLSYNHFAGKLARDRRLMGKIIKMKKRILIIKDMALMFSRAGVESIFPGPLRKSLPVKEDHD